MTISRRSALVLSAGGLAGLATHARAATLSPPEPVYRDIVYGDPNAKLTVIEYGSLSCHYCADFHINSFPKLEADYIDTGKINFLYRDFPTDNISAAGAVMARCAPGEGGKAIIAAAYKNQKDWIMSATPFEQLVNYAAIAGMSVAQIEACFKNKPILDAVTSVRDEALATYRLKVTPTFVVGAIVVEGSNYEQLKTVLDKVLATPRK